MGKKAFLLSCHSEWKPLYDTKSSPTSSTDATTHVSCTTKSCITSQLLPSMKRMQACGIEHNVFNISLKSKAFEPWVDITTYGLTMPIPMHSISLGVHLSNELWMANNNQPCFRWEQVLKRIPTTNPYDLNGWIH